MSLLTKRIAQLKRELKQTSFWYQPLQTGITWFLCAWAVGSVLIFAPMIARLIKSTM